MTPEPIKTTDDPRLTDYLNVRDADLLGRRGVFMAEGRFVVRTLLTQSPLRCRSVLLTPAAWDSVLDELEAAAAREGPSPEVLLATQEVMNSIVGFDIHRGCLAVGERPRGNTVDALLTLASRAPQGRGLVILENLTNHDNVGSIFRSALALGAAGVLLSPGCCDPLYRKSIRVSMGAALRLPYAVMDDWHAGIGAVKAAGYKVAALATGSGSEDLDAFANRSDHRERWALMVGTEGQGLSEAALGIADKRLRIAMVEGVDSLNAGVAAAIAMHRLFNA